MVLNGKAPFLYSYDTLSHDTQTAITGNFRSAVLIDSKLATSNEDSILLREITNITYNMPSIPESFMKVVIIFF